MALTVETGSGSATANSYVSVADFQAYLTERGLTVTGDEEQLLRAAMDYIESQNFIGEKNTKEQALQWPRNGAYIDGFLIEEDEIPALLIKAQMDTAVSIDAGNNPLSTLDRETKREKVGEIEIEYSDGAKIDADLRLVDASLKKLIIGGGTVGVVGLYRA